MTGTTQRQRAQNFLALHTSARPLLMPNAWDGGSARMLEWMGFEAIATTSSGSAAALGRLDGDLSADEVFAHAATIVASTGLPVSADLENCFAAVDDLDGVATTARRAADVGLSGFSIEDYGDGVIYDRDQAARRVAVAAEAAHETGLVVTARAENHIRGRDDLADTIARLQAYQDAGADVLYAPGVSTAEQIAAVVAAVDRPVNVLAVANTPPVPRLAELGVSRVSVGGAFAFAALDALVEAGRQLREEGVYDFTERSRRGAAAARAAFAQH